LGQSAQRGKRLHQRRVGGFYLTRSWLYYSFY
jgi:hypothetical protein